MKRILLPGTMLLASLACQSGLALSGLFFNVTTKGSTLSITTTIPNHTYPNAGIKINAPGYTIVSGCTPNANSYCLFSTSDTAPATITLKGSNGSASATLCLNGLGPLSCQNYNLPVAARASFIYVGDVDTYDVLTFPATGNGNIAPTYNLNGSNTQTVEPYDLYLDSTNKLWVSNYEDSNAASITQFSLPATGNVSPLIDITGGNTTLLGPVGIGRDAAENIYVADYNLSAINVFAPTANGNATPIRRIFGGNTLLSDPESIVVTPAGNVFAANSVSPSVTEYAAGATGNVSPIRVITCASFSRPTGLWIDDSGNIWVSDSGANSIFEFSPDASGLSIPIRTISGSNTKIVYPYGIAVDAAGYIYEVGPSYAGINVFSPSANGNVAPIQSITGSNTLLISPAGLAIK